VSRQSAVIGVSDHNGWAVLVTVAGDGALLDRRRVELVGEGLPIMPHHHEGQTLPLEEALDLVERVRLSAVFHAKLSLDAIATSVPSRIQGLAMRACPRIPPTVAERIKDYRAQTVADTVMYRNAIAGAAEERGWAIHWYDAKKVIDAACRALHVEDLEAHFFQLKRSVGPPWTKDHRIAMSAAIVAAQALQPYSALRLHGIATREPPQPPLRKGGMKRGAPPVKSPP
jgi:hypothetical protein